MDIWCEPIWASMQLIQCLASYAGELQLASTHGDQERSYHVNTPHPWQVQGREYACVPGTTCERAAIIMPRSSNGGCQSPIPIACSTFEAFYCGQCMTSQGLDNVQIRTLN
jgi:hypothetical protein